MAEITVRGFVSKPEVKEGSKGKFSKFSLSEGQKQQDGTYKKVWYNVTNFKSETPPEDGSKVDVKGYLKMKEHNGKTYYDVTTTEDITVVDGPKPRESKGTAGATGTAAEKDPWE